MQESRIMASLANDKNMIDLLLNGDIHSYVARVSFKEIPNDYPITDVKENYHDFRQKAKYVEFAIAYAGDEHTIQQRINCTPEKAKEIYNAYMDAFPLVKSYQNYCRHNLKQLGYILMDNVTNAKCFIPDWERLQKVQECMQNPGFWTEMSIDPELRSEYNYYKKAISEWSRAAINYRIQRRGSGCFKMSMIIFFNYIVANNLLHKVKFTISAHDENNFEAPKEIAEDLAKIYQQCVLKGSKPFCPNIDMDSDVSRLKDGTLPNYWIH